MNIPSSWVNNNGPAQRAGVNTISVVSEPASISSNGNMMAMRFRYNELNPSATKSFFQFRVNGVIAPASILNISTPVGNLRLTGSNTPSYSQFLTNGGSSLVQRSIVAESIAMEIQQSAIGQHYEVSATDDVISITAINYGNFDMIVTLPSGATLITSTNGQDKYIASQYKDYSLFVDIYSCQGRYGQLIDKNTGERKSLNTYPFVNNGEQYAQLDGALSGVTSLIWPTKRRNYGVGVKYMDNTGMGQMLVPYFVVYGDYYRYVTNGEKKMKNVGISSVLWTQIGRKDFLEYYDFSQYVLNIGTGTPFSFMNTNTDKTITMDSHQYVQFINTDNAYGWRCAVIAEIRFIDGSISYEYYTLPSLSIGGNIVLDVSPNCLGLTTIEDTAGKLIDSYSIRLSWEVSNIFPYQSVPVHYRIWRQCSAQPKNMIYLNENGGWESIELISKEGQELSFDIDTYTSSLPFNANRGSFGNSFALRHQINPILNKNVSKTFIGETLLLNKEEYTKLESLVKSRYVGVFDPEQGNYRPVTIIETDYRVVDRPQTLTVQYQYNPINA